jgi:hypothetical protein
MKSAAAHRAEVADLIGDPEPLAAIAGAIPIAGEPRTARGESARNRFTVFKKLSCCAIATGFCDQTRCYFREVRRNELTLWSISSGFFPRTTDFR